MVAAGSLTPQRVREYYEVALDAGLDVLVIQGTVISAEHVSSSVEPLNLKEFIAELPVPCIVGGCASYSTGLHLMRTGAVGVLVGVGPGAACTTRGVLGIGVPQATAIADVQARALAAHARDRHVRERDRGRRHAQRRRHRQGVRLRRRRGDDRLAAGARARGARPRLPLGHGDVPLLAAARRARRDRSRTARWRRSCSAPRTRTTARFNLFGALRTSMATCGYEDIPSFHRAEVMIAPALQTEGKQLQREQHIGMGSNGKAPGRRRRSPSWMSSRWPAPWPTACEPLRRRAPPPRKRCWSSTSVASTPS